jgi:hypothetical protein
MEAAVSFKPMSWCRIARRKLNILMHIARKKKPGRNAYDIKPENHSGFAPISFFPTVTSPRMRSRKGMRKKRENKFYRPAGGPVKLKNSTLKTDYYAFYGD